MSSKEQNGETLLIPKHEFNWSNRIFLTSITTVLSVSIAGFGGYLLGKRANTPYSQSIQQQLKQPSSSTSKPPTISPSFIPTSIPTAVQATTTQWLQYKADTYGYMVKYPPELELTGIAMAQGGDAWFGNRINLLYAGEIDYFSCQSDCEISRVRQTYINSVMIKFGDITIKENNKVSDHYLMYQYKIDGGFAYLIYNDLKNNSKIVPKPNVSPGAQSGGVIDQIAVFHEMATTFRVIPKATPDPKFPKIE